MKKLIFTGLFCVIAGLTTAQVFEVKFPTDTPQEETVSPVVREKIEEYSNQIRAIVIDEKLLMNSEIEKVNTRLENGEITEESAEEMKKSISIDFSNKINTEIEKIEFDLDEIIKQQVKFSVMNTDINQLKKEKVSHKKRPTRNEITGYLGFGMITFTGKENKEFESHNGFNSGIDAGFIYHRQLGRTSPFTLKTGFYFSWRTLRFSDNYLMNRDENGVVDLVQNDTYLTKSKLRTTYLMFPLGVEFSTASKKYDSNNNPYRKVEEGINFTFNLYGGFRFSNNNIVKGDGIKFRDKDTHFNQNNFAYGAQFTVDLKSINLYIRQEFSPFFKENTIDNRKMMQFGVTAGF